MADRTFVIAEAGVNHNGSLDLALQLVDVAAAAKADAVKFQSFKATKLATVGAAKADYQVANMKEAGNQLGMLQRLELSDEDHHALVRRCKERSIHFMSTAFDAESLAFLATLGMPALKVPSGDITCAPLLLQAARLRMPMIVSTGMSTLADIEDALGVIAFGLISDHEPASRADFVAAYCSAAGRSALEQHVTLLHCVTQYPAPPESVNLRAINSIAAAFRLPVGYSDHTLGGEVTLAAVASGAAVIEKHFTLDRKSPGPDHAASLEPGELVALIAAIRRVEDAMGSPIKSCGPAEASNRVVARRSIVASRSIKVGEVIAADAITSKRPGGGISPMDFWDLVGTRASRDFAADDPIER